MALCEFHFFSESLGLQTTAYVVIPQKSTSGEIGVENNAGTDRYKCLYLLHGLSDDASIWLRRTSIERYAQKYGVCVVMPFGGKSFYTDMKYGEKYYTYIAKELPRIIREFFNVSEKREDNFIAGLSMGGYGALKIGMKECEHFCAAAGLSSVADLAGDASMFEKTLIPVFGDDLTVPDSENLLKIAEQTNKNTNKPRIFMGVGTEDFMYAGNQKLKEKFEELSFDFTYRESCGAHGWEFWDEYIQYVLEWMFG
ncbi:MAG: esterase family protein [Clostridia bacterium]|nr:esterase family protein [Clostridia bacterium]